MPALALHGPAAIVTEITSTSFSVQITAAGNGSTLYLGVRPLGSTEIFADNGFGPTVVGETITYNGLTTGVPLEWRVQETSGTTIFDGTHGQVTPDSSIWPTLEAIVTTACGGAGVTAGNTADAGGVAPYSDVYAGQFWPANVPERAVLLKSGNERTLRRANNVKLTCFPLMVKIQVKETEDTGSRRKALTEEIQQYLRRAFDQKAADAYPSIPGLDIISVDVTSKDDMANRDNEYDEAMASALRIDFEVWESRT